VRSQNPRSGLGSADEYSRELVVEFEIQRKISSVHFRKKGREWFETTMRIWGPRRVLRGLEREKPPLEGLQGVVTASLGALVIWVFVVVVCWYCGLNSGPCVW
jgi:hypothetical protein